MAHTSKITHQYLSDDVPTPTNLLFAIPHTAKKSLPEYLTLSAEMFPQSKKEN